MSTKPPSTVEQAPANSSEKIAYMSVEGVATLEPNDRNRLGYHVWRWMTTRQGTLDQAVGESGARLSVNREEATRIIRDALMRLGVSF